MSISIIGNLTQPSLEDGGDIEDDIRIVSYTRRGS